MGQTLHLSDSWQDVKRPEARILVWRDGCRCVIDVGRSLGDGVTQLLGRDAGFVAIADHL